MNYTYRQLLEALQELSSDELDMQVIVYDQTREEYHSLNYAGRCEGDGIVDAFHTLLIINDPDETVSEPPPAIPGREFPDIRSCEIWLEFADGSTLTTDGFLDMDKCIETQIRDTFEARSVQYHSATRSGSAIVNFKWKELGI